MIEFRFGVKILIGRQRLTPRQPIGAGNARGAPFIRLMIIDDQQMVANPVKTVRIAAFRQFPRVGLRPHFLVKYLISQTLGRSDFAIAARQAEIKPAIMRSVLVLHAVSLFSCGRWASYAGGL